MKNVKGHLTCDWRKPSFFDGTRRVLRLVHGRTFHPQSGSYGCSKIKALVQSLALCTNNSRKSIPATISAEAAVHGVKARLEKNRTGSSTWLKDMLVLWQTILHHRIPHRMTATGFADEFVQRTNESRKYEPISAIIFAEASGTAASQNCRKTATIFEEATLRGCFANPVA